MKVSDYIIYLLENRGIKDVFLLSGGGMMHLLDSVFKSKVINKYCNLHEQASAICADAYAQVTRELAVCMVTSGPGATNAITGVVSSWIDSEPVLVISGQAKTTDLVGDRGVRQTGSQEVNISEIMKCATKYIVTIKDKNMVRYHVEKAIYLATHGRRGPAWVDVPLDIQGAQIEIEDQVPFDPIAEGFEDKYTVSTEDLDYILKVAKEAKRPLILIGKGVQADKMDEKIKSICYRLQIPAIATWRAKMIFADDDEMFFGYPGSPGPRYSNWILQTCDFLLIIGSRLNQGITAFNESHFAYNARKVIVDIDPNEIKKLSIPFEKSLVCDAKTFITELDERTKEMSALDTAQWIDYCREAKLKYPVYSEKQANEQTLINMYLFGHELSLRTKDTDVIVEGSSGRSCGIIGLSYDRREGQIEIGAMGLGSMGFALPASIGACVASGKQRTITLDGDGSLQHNLQELSLIRGYNLPIKLFVLNNNGYASIAVMQDNHFQSRYAGSGKTSGVFCCDMKKLANLYDLKYDAIHNDNEIGEVLDRVLADDEPVLCEVFADYTFDEIPKAVTKVNPDGSLSSGVLEDLFPFLPEEETRHWMSVAETERA
ncbi:MAG: thiamine pyrophosphate-binding protein [Lachnospiraceae bacterium]|nr:thiamine pyrophosphate-binding protein [Lachnospiraceae bacterium]